MTLTLVNYNFLACSIKTFEIFTECFSYVVTETKQDFTKSKDVCMNLDGKMASEDLKDRLLANLLKNNCFKFYSIKYRL